ncbi:calcineurin subunit B type 2-like [Lethenteron reissneri]|uniref:calcineurin subunit B type 2-like n=1 Tax=Lethenteron reissneri TaxID=7753 RepID=UPI002AB79F46|nr:calcineurin subunit B type 2-like [Lethenteron reissneri]
MDWESLAHANFEAIDMDNDGFISYADYHDFLEMNGVDQDCTSVDKNKDGKISFEEFSEFYKKDSDQQKEKLKLKK